jgi:hypothetical protein
MHTKHKSSMVFSSVIKTIFGQYLLSGLVCLVLSVIFLTPANQALAAGDKKEEKAPAKGAAKAPAKPAEGAIVPTKPKGDVVMESISQPIVRGRKIVSYDHATIILWLRTRDHASIVCENRYKLADSFLLDLHDNPIGVRQKKEGHADAEERLYNIALETFGPRVVKRLRVEWGRSPTGGKTTIFGTFTDVQCDASS